MAGSIASLFGPSAEEIVYERQKEERERNDLNFYRGLQAIDVPGVATGMVIGRSIGQGLEQVGQGLFGESQEIQDPRLTKALQMKQIFEGITAADMRNPDKLEALAQRAIDTGNIEAAFQLDQMAVDARTALNPDLKELGTRFRLPDGRVVTGGFLPDGRAVGIDAEGNRFALGDEYIKMGTKVDPASDNQVTQAGAILDEMGLNVKDGTQARIANAALQAVADSGYTLDYGTAVMEVAKQMLAVPDNNATEVDYKSIGLSRPVNKDAGEVLRVNPNATASIIGPDGTVLETTNRQLSQDQINGLTNADVDKPKRNLDDPKFLESLGIPNYSKVAGDTIQVDPNTRYVYVIDRKGRRKGTSNRALTKQEAGVVNKEPDTKQTTNTSYNYKDSPLYSEGIFTSTAEAVEQYKRRRANKTNAN